jgi:hypothetical protein
VSRKEPGLGTSSISITNKAMSAGPMNQGGVFIRKIWRRKAEIVYIEPTLAIYKQWRELE